MTIYVSYIINLKQVGKLEGYFIELFRKYILFYFSMILQTLPKTSEQQGQTKHMPKYDSLILMAQLVTHTVPSDITYFSLKQAAVGYFKMH